MEYLSIIIVVGILGFIVFRLREFFKSDKSRDDFLDTSEDVAIAAKVMAVIGSAFAWFLAPSSLIAIFVNPPLIVTIKPALLTISGGALVIYSLAKLYDKRKKRTDKAAGK